MKLSVSETAKLFGISVRALHYYDEIGLVKPSEYSEAGYRFYDSEAIALLQQVLFYRELEVPLKKIGQILHSEGYDRNETLARHKELLLLKKRHLEDLIALVDETIGGSKMAKITVSDIEAAKKKYAAEVEEKWGKSDAFAECKAKHEGYDSEKELMIAEEANEIFAAFAKISDSDPASEEAQALVKRWQEHITEYHYNCTKEILASLGMMYVGDERFTESIDRFGDGTAAFMSEAIAVYCK